MEVTMRKLITAGAAVALAVGLSVAAGGSAYAGPSTTSRIVHPASSTPWTGTGFMDDMTGCGAAHRMHLNDTSTASTLP
jgi:hypothetical protein